MMPKKSNFTENLLLTSLFYEKVNQIQHPKDNIRGFNSPNSPFIQATVSCLPLGALLHDEIFYNSSFPKNVFLYQSIFLIPFVN